MKKELRIGSLKLNNPFILAPLAGITDAPMRLLCQEQGAALTYSEMVSGNGLWFKDKNTDRLLYTYEEEEPVGFQIFGNKPEIMAFATEKLENYPNAVLDFNLGCPVPKVVKNNEGSALMKSPELVYDLIRAMVSNTKKPVTAKIRLGWDMKSINAVEVAKAVEAAGASAITVHGRTREQFYSGEANWDEIRKVREVVDIPVIANGDVVDWPSAKEIMERTGCQLVMIGRGALGNPWIFHELNLGYSGKASDAELVQMRPSPKERSEMMMRHLGMLAELKGEYAAVRQMRKHVGWYCKGIHGAAAFRGRISEITDMGVLMKEIEELGN